MCRLSSVRQLYSVIRLWVVWCIGAVICFFYFFVVFFSFVFCFQAEDGIRDLVRSRGLGDVYKRQPQYLLHTVCGKPL